MRGDLNEFIHDPQLLRRDGDVGFAGGLVIGLLIAIPLWMLIAVALHSAFQQGPIDGGTILAFMVAAVCEVLLARRALKPYATRLWRRWFPVFNRSAWNSAHRRRHAARRAPAPGTQAISYLETIAGKRINSVQDLLAVVGPPASARPRTPPLPAAALERPSTLRQTIAFASLAIAYLHYYFWDVNLQIASMHSLTVFVAVTPLQKIVA